MSRTLSAIRRSLREFLRQENGVSAIEFAAVLPFMVFLYVGGVEYGEGIAIQYRTTITARTVADLATQYVTINNATMNSILGASSTVIAPYSSANITVILSQITVDAGGTAKITWSDTLNGTAHSVGEVVTLPAALDTPGISLMWGEVTYSYTPQIGDNLIGTIPIRESIYLYPRLSNSVARVNS